MGTNTTSSDIEAEVGLRDSIVSTARNEIGVVGGIEYKRDLGYPDDVPWCSIFTCWTYRKNEVNVPDGCAFSPNWFPDDKVIRSKSARKGDIIGIYYRNLGRIGHTGILEEDWGDGNTVTVVEGNISNRVVRKIRSKNQINKLSNWID